MPRPWPAILTLAASLLVTAMQSAQAPPATAPRLLVVDPDLQPHEGAIAVVATLPDAADWANAHANAHGLVIRVVAGFHTVRRTARFLAPTHLTLVGELGLSSLRGGARLQQPCWRPCDPQVAARLPLGAKEHVRSLVLPPQLLTDWQGGLAGPVHSGHSVAVQSVRSEVYISGTAMVLARWPDRDYAAIASVIDPGSVPRDAADDVPLARRRNEPPRGGVFTIADKERLRRWQGATGFWANGLWNWDWASEQLPVAKVDGEAGTISLGLPHVYGLGPRGKFYVTDLPEELDEPGEYWIDRERGVLHAWLHSPGQEMGDVEVTLLQQPIVELVDARDVEISGLWFGRTRGDALVARGVDGLRIDDCRFCDIGTRALVVDGNNATVTRCKFDGIGGTGVVLSGGDRATLAPSGSRIEDCSFTDCGRVLRTYQPAIQLHGVGHQVLHNEIAHHPHIALMFDGNDHRIEANFIHSVVLDTGDAGAIYCGRDWTSHGTMIAGNVFADIPGTDARYQNGVYLDDMASGITVVGNLFVRCNWGMLLGGGRDLTLRDNAFVACGKAMSFDARGTGWMKEALDDPSTSTLHRRLAAMPIDSAVWRRRFPTLKDYLTDRFGRPVNGIVEGTLLVGTPLGRIDDRECVRETGTKTLAMPADELARQGDEWLAAVRKGRIKIDAFAVGPVGPR